MNGAAKSTPTRNSSRSRCALVFHQRKNQINCQELQRVFIKGALELSGNEAPETSPPIGFYFGRGNVSVCGHPAHPICSRIRKMKRFLTGREVD